MTPLTKLRRKVDKAVDSGRRLRVDAQELLLLNEHCGPVVREHAEHELRPNDFPKPGPQHSLARVKRALRRGPAKPTWVYFIQHGRDGPIKIGRAHNVEKRFEALRTGSPEPLVLLAVSQGHDEREVHAFYERERIRGEWFRPSPRLRAFIASLDA